MKKNENKVRAWRKRHGWTRPEAAEKLGMPFNTYKAREGGHRPVTKLMETAMRCLDLEHPVKVPS